MIFSIIAFILNISTTVLNIIAANRNHRRRDELNRLESELIDYAMRMPDIESEIKRREHERRMKTRYIVTAEMIDPEKIADPELRHEIIMRRLFAGYSPN